jgi:hypothetical protein
MAMIAMTTSNSIRVNARRGFIPDKNTGNGDSFQAINFSREILLYPRQPFLPDAVKLHRRHFPKRRGFFFQREANESGHFFGVGQASRLSPFLNF